MKLQLGNLILTVILSALSLHIAGDLDLVRKEVKFSQSLFSKISGVTPSLVYSPYSIHSVISLTCAGARGATQGAMRRTLGLKDGELQTFHNAYRRWNSELTSDTIVKVHVANGLFVKPGLPIEPSFHDLATSQYQAVSRNLDLSAQGGPEVPINTWVAEKTSDMIQNLLPPGTVNDLTALVLVNTIFFNGSWTFPFSQYKTKDADFTLPDHSVATVKMMNAKNDLLYKSDSTLRAHVVDLPFHGGNFSMTVVLPHAGTSLATLEGNLTSQDGATLTLLEGLHTREVDLYLPKFRIESGFSLKKALTDLGMGLAFDKDNANFTGIVRDVPTYISDVFHKAVIEVNERGTTASAATAMVMSKMSLRIDPDGPVVVRADRPFLFFLRDVRNGGILFQGKFSGPARA